MTNFDIIFCVLVSNDCLAKHFTEDCIKICKNALQFLSDVAGKLREGRVMVQELEMLTSHLTQSVNLFSPKVVDKIISDPSFNIADVINQGNSDVKKFTLYCSKVRILLKHCGNILNGMYLVTGVK